MNIHIKKLRNFLFKEELEDIERERLMVNIARRQVEKNEEKRKQLTTRDLVREIMAGFNFAPLDEQYTLAELIERNSVLKGDDYSMEGVLADAHELDKNKAFTTALQYVISNQVIYTAQLAETEGQTMFGRGSINGAQLVEEAVNEMIAMYNQRRQDRLDSGEEVEGEDTQEEN